MLDPRRLRTELDALKQGLARRGVDTSVLDTAADLDERQRAAAGKRDDLRGQVNTISKEVGQLFKAGDKAAAEAKKEKSRALGDQEKAAEDEARQLGEELRETLLRIPNIPSEDAPDGDGPEQNPLVKIENYYPDQYDPHQQVPHWEVGAELAILDLERGAKLSGSMFP